MTTDSSGADQIRAHEEERRRCRSATPALAPDALTSRPGELVPRDVQPDSISGWKAVADGFLTDQACAFHRNVEISSRYAWMYKLLPDCFKWAGMAAIASHHVRLALFPLRLDTDRTGYVDIPRSLGRQKMLRMEDVHTIRATNNAIFNDIFWVHLAYVSTERRNRPSALPARGGAPLRPRALGLRDDRPRAPGPGRPDRVGGGTTGGR